MLEQREKVGKLCKAVDIRERPSLRSAEHGPVQSCWHHTKTKQEIKITLEREVKEEIRDPHQKGDIHQMKR